MIHTTPKLEYFKSKEEVTAIKNLRLDGYEKLCADKITTIYEVSRNIHPKTRKPSTIAYRIPKDEETEIITYDLVEIQPEELDYYREERIPSFVLKTDGKFYIGKIPKTLSFVGSLILGCHKCATSSISCDRLLARSDEEGGCAKVRDRFKRIEKYPWITRGFETFNTNHDSFVVAECLHFKHESHRRPALD